MEDVMFKFNVYGQKMLVERNQDNWLLYRDSECGAVSRVHDVVIPSMLKPDQLAGYLDDMYHEYACNAYPQVFEID